MTSRNTRGVLFASVVGSLALAVIGYALTAEGQTAAPGSGHWFRGGSGSVRVTAVGVPLQTVASFPLPAGSWALHGSATVAVNDVYVAASKLVHKGSISCSFAGGADGFTVTSPSQQGAFGYSTGMRLPVSFGAALTFSAPITLTLDCNENSGGDVTISAIQLIAVPLGSVTRH